MDVREKLVELLSQVQSYGVKQGNHITHQEGKTNREIASHLIAHGVTVQEWIFANEPPKENGYYLCYVLTSAVGDKVKYEQMPLYWEDDIWLYRHNSYRMCRNVTNWMPLPQPPKGE